MIEIRELHKYFGEVKAVNGISFTVQKGEIFGFLGPNGAGKSTTIRCLMDFIRPTSGSLTIAGLDAQRDSVAIKRKVGYVSPDVHLYPHWTGKQHLDFVERLNSGGSWRKELVKRFSLKETVRAKNLSSGNKQKLGLILAMMGKPELLILDEPTVALDPLLQNLFYESLKTYQQEGGTVFISSHNLSEIERICDRVAIIRQGKLADVDNVATLRKRKMHMVTLRLAGKAAMPDPTEFGKVEIISRGSDQLTFRYTGEINDLVKRLARYEIADLEIAHASLEDVFLEFYKN
ncbi:ABC transporter ATP-binding protein [Patescibacteria group bacterium]|nr:ABC transporter ATP-binding protein [Patescibacteria group bacterium]